MSCEDVSEPAQHTVKRETHPALRCARLVEEDENESRPESTKHGDQADYQAHDQCRRNQVAQCLHAQEAREGIALHGLEHVVFGDVENFWVVAALLLNRGRHVMRNGARERDLSLGSREEERVQDLLRGRSDILTIYSVRGRVRVGHVARTAEFGAWSHGAGAALGRVVALVLTQERRHLRILVSLLFR